MRSRSTTALRLCSLGAIVLASQASCIAEVSPEDEPGSSESPLVVCAGPSTLRGIDVSYWQGTINWDAVRAAGIRFAFMRASHGLSRDTQFARNWRESRRVGIYRGAYHYFEPDLDVSAQADLFTSTMGALAPGDLAPVLDVEDTGGVGASTLVSRAQAWVRRVEGRTHRTTIIYTGKYFWEDNCGASSAMLSHPLWVAQYGPRCPDLPRPWTHWKLWQHSSTGHVSGISGYVDLDWFNGDIEALRRFANACVPEVCNGRDDDCDGHVDEDVCDRASVAAEDAPSPIDLGSIVTVHVVFRNVGTTTWRPTHYGVAATGDGMAVAVRGGITSAVAPGGRVAVDVALTPEREGAETFWVAITRDGHRLTEHYDGHTIGRRPAFAARFVDVSAPISMLSGEEQTGYAIVVNEGRQAWPDDTELSVATLDGSSGDAADGGSPSSDGLVASGGPIGAVEPGERARVELRFAADHVVIDSVARRRLAVRKGDGTEAMWPERGPTLDIGLRPSTEARPASAPLEGTGEASTELGSCSIARRSDTSDHRAPVSAPALVALLLGAIVVATRRARVACQPGVTRDRNASTSRGDRRRMTRG